ncbi:hypothetical protein NHF50_10220 [Flavobacterium sp. NRK F10]|uniref:DUF6705 family protein n=1 Tax=Flavobacterium sp. NRK F10 TaxID=2954931 RepID=UPI002091295A|nr:DUF6705 family protein [Flavobacterium sp. NRK F10]MCO6175417.1 hypothetical protein [Flavobacterium sp. NRK F10]
MKNILFTILIVFTFISCKAQIVPLDASYWEYPQGTYIKDTFNEMDKFVGTWQYTQGTDTLTIVLQKKIHIYNGEYYEDFLNGGYRYVSNGVEIVNTLSLLNDLTNVNGDNSKIQGGLILPNDMYPICNDCIPNERRFKLYFSDPERNYLSSSLVLRYLPQSLGEPEKMTATLIDNDSVMIPDENSPTTLRVPYGEYLMVKQ